MLLFSAFFYMSITALLPTVSVINRCEKGFFFSKNFFGLYCSLHDPPNIYFCIYHGTRLFFPPDFWWIALKWPIFSVFQWDLNDSMQATWFDWAKCLFFPAECTFLSQDILPWKKYILTKESWETKNIKGEK